MTEPTTAVLNGGLMSTYPSQPVTFVHGEGTVLFDDEGNRYLDFLSGLAVTSLGHAHPEVAQAIAEQAARLLHVSNLFSTEPGPKLAALVDELIGGGGLVFFCNSGAEANEAAIKLARKWAGPGRHVVITADRSFHGRTLATLHATGQPQKHGPFQPLPEGFRHVAWNDAGALADAIDDTVAAVLLEPIQGEAGVWPADLEYLSAVETICAENEVLFMVDEVQTGLARTGEWFAFHHYDVSPDVVTMAKALGNGVPIGATWAKRRVADAFQPGDHATTFGGQPLAASAALKVVEVMIRIDAPTRATEAGALLRAGLSTIDAVSEVRGRGLLIACELEGISAPAAAKAALDSGLVVNAVTPTALRLAPPLTVTNTEIGEAVEILKGALS